MADEGLRSIIRDDAYHVERVLADGPSGRTELVTLDGEGPLVRKRIPLDIANPAVWAALVGIEEPLLPRVEELYLTPDELVVVYAYVEGESLRDLLAREGRLGEVRAVGVICDVCTAAAALHARGVVHRDITPGNVIVAADGAHLVDLGIARMRNETGTRDTTNLGTWGFAAPEQFGFAQTDARSDVFAIGRLLGHVLVGVQPDSEAFDVALDDRELVSEPLAAIVRKATQFEPSARYQSVTELREELQAAEAPRQAGQAEVPLAAERDSRAAETSDAQDLPRQEDLAPRRLREAPAHELLGAIVAWGLLGTYVLLVAVATALALLTGDPPWELGEYLLGVDTVVMALCTALDVYRCVRRIGPYAHQRRRIALLLQHILILMAIAFIVFILIVFLVAILDFAK